MVKTKANKSYPINHYINFILFISFSALVLDLVISLASISVVKQQSTRYLQDTADLYINRINHDFAYINHYMGWTLANDESLDTMDSEPVNSVTFLKANLSLHKRFTELQKNYEQEYQFFYYLKKHQFFLNCAPIHASYSDYLEIKIQIMADVEDKNVYENFYSKWTPILVNKTYYMINIVPYHDSYLIGLVSADDLVAPLRQVNLGKNGYASLIDEQGNIISTPISENEKIVQRNTGILNFVQSRTTVISRFTNAAFNVKMVFRFGAFETIMIAQLLIMLLFFIVTFALCAVMLLFRNKVLSPLRSFSENLSHINEDSESADFKSSKIAELEQANAQFKNLIVQIKKFKIDRYEQELEKQNIRLDYMKLQIRPHFFLNCLTSIYSMAQMQMVEEIEKMTMSTSNYFRYIFQNSEDFVCLKDEIEHVRIYLDIQKSRYRNAFSYCIEQSEDTASAMIPPLLLQTFIENSVKYAVSRDDELQIKLFVCKRIPYEEDERVIIRITDTGPGFPPDILRRLSNGQPLEQTGGSRIGIMNALQRLELLYNHQAAIKFSNLEDGGACIIISLPQK